MTQPDTTVIAEPKFDTLEVVDTGEAFILMQPVETDEVQTIVIGHQQLTELAKLWERLG